ncbi:MAG: PQQ-binding-like beta-propeller repeat protein, partial [Planctomycetes bacterium]|nr:PQQ-binding-like beta-propeller repeat protein [Planctomycetota bacterium]
EAPLHWSATENVKWKTKLPGPGNSTPIVWEDKVFVTGADETGLVCSLICFDRNTGSELWKRSARVEEMQLTHKTNPYCASSPVTDGKRVYAWLDSAGLFAFDLDGKELWRKDLGKFEHIWGTASSPVIYKDLLIVSAGPGLNAFVAAMNKDTGEEVWRISPPGITSEKVDEYRGSWSTPVMLEADGATQMILMLPERLYALDPETGKEIWSCGGLGKLCYTSALVSDDVIVAMSGFHGPAIGVRTGGKGDVTSTHRLWRHEDRKMLPQRVGSGVIVDGYVYILNEPGIAWCLDPKTGEVLWEERLSGKSWCSLVYAAGRIYATTERGETIVIEPNPEECKVLAENKVGELTRGSLAFSDGEVFQRTYEHLYCFEE